MKTVKARVHGDEPVTEDVLERAIAESNKRRGTSPHAKAVRYLAAFDALG